jgi:lipoprotein-anchoring transpeptidase ErfK/SrfK
LAALVGFALPGWAGWNDVLQASLTATPTRTPRPVTAEPQPVVPRLVIVTTAIPAKAAPGPAAVPAPPPASEAVAARPALTPYLAAVVARYGIDAGRRFVVVDPNTQRMTIWEPDQPVRELPVSTGDVSQGWRTAAWYGLVGHHVGTFNAFGVYADDAWYLFRDAGDILIHSAPYRLVDGVKEYQALDALGSYPASRGCIRLRPEDARWFTSWQPEGVPLVILPRS